MRKKKQQMLKTQIECQKVKRSSWLFLSFSLFLFCPYFFNIFVVQHLFTKLITTVLPGSDQPSGEESRYEAWGEGQHHENTKGAHREDYPAAEWNEPCPPDLKWQNQPQPAQNQDWRTFKADAQLRPLNIYLCVQLKDFNSCPNLDFFFSLWKGHFSAHF